MANAKRCDICGEFYEVPTVNHLMHLTNENMNTSMVQVLRRKNIDDRTEHDILQFDSCEGCLQDVIDYMLTRRAESEKENRHGSQRNS